MVSTSAFRIPGTRTISVISGPFVIPDIEDTKGVQLGFHHPDIFLAVIYHDFHPESERNHETVCILEKYLVFRIV
jgi:hypothetical protein